MKSILTCLFFVTSSFSWACGPMIYQEDLFYNLVPQEVLADKSFSPFYLFLDNGLSWDNSDIKASEKRIYREWAAHFEGRLSAQDVEEIMFQLDDEAVKMLSRGENPNELSDQYKLLTGKKYQRFWNYLAFARRCDALNSQTYDAIWDGDGIDRTASKRLINEAIDKWDSSDNFYKARYGYQLMKLSLLDDSADAKTLFETYVEPIKADQAIYYYSLDHYAKDMLYQQDNAVEAAYYYLSVFNEVPEKRRNAYISFSYAVQGINWEELYTQCTTKEEQAAFVFLESFTQGNSPTEAAREVYALDPNSKYLYLLAARSLNGLERVLNGRDFYQFQPAFCGDVTHFPESEHITYYDHYENPLLDNDVKGLKELADAALFNSAIEEKAKWELIRGQIAFLERDTKLGSAMISRAAASNNPEIKAVSNVVQALLTVAGTENIDRFAEARFFKSYATLKAAESEDGKDQWYGYVASKLDLFWKVIHQKYTEQGEHTKAYLSLNSLQNQEYYQERCLLEELEQLYSRPVSDYSEWNQLLMTKDGVGNPINQVKDYLATTYIHELNIDGALDYYEEIADSGVSTTDVLYFDGITNSVFNTSIKTCFECDEETVLWAEDFSDYPFIKATMNKYELALALKQLQKKSKKDPYAAYLLGNFYHNINTKGYFRELFSYTSFNGINREYESHLQPASGEFWESLYAYHVLPINHLTTQQFYQTALEHSKVSDELRAKAAWGMVRMYQGYYEKRPELQEEYWGFRYSAENLPDYIADISPWVGILEELEDEVFSRQVIQECAFIYPR